ncbi:MAG: Uma2 family endonuclease [Gemmataceae bacterium]|nr:Uma2 family endonuclease [Gemmataceae bacterium]MDW8264039.1 Uma2 family endonuclease [Gemmataceae bacterium]
MTQTATQESVAVRGHADAGMVAPPGPSTPDALVLEGASWPDHTQLPDSDGRPAENFLEHPQSILLTSSILPLLHRRHPDGQFAIGQNSGLYWRYTEPSLLGCKAPDWFYVPGVPPMLEGQVRRSYVMWKEIVSPLVVIEFASGDGSEERDRTPWHGKFWVYEQAVHAAYYVIFEPFVGRVEAYHLVDGRYVPLELNHRGHYELPAMEVEVGLWRGSYLGIDTLWLRFWDREGNLLLSAEERAEQERQRAERLAERLRALGVDPEAV